MVFECRDVLDLGVTGAFDIVTAARTLQWVADPGAAILRMGRALKPHGRLVLLDFVHVDNTWDPAPPEAFRRFYSALLEWRAANGWDNQLGNHLESLAAAAGFSDVAVSAADETASRSDPALTPSCSLANAIQSIGQDCCAGFLSESDRLAAERDYRVFVTDEINRQSLHALTSPRLASDWTMKPVKTILTANGGSCRRHLPWVEHELRALGLDASTTPFPTTSRRGRSSGCRTSNGSMPTRTRS
jgi:SAM-dependent methyltransferase